MKEEDVKNITSWKLPLKNTFSATLHKNHELQLEMELDDTLPKENNYISEIRLYEKPLPGSKDFIETNLNILHSEILTKANIGSHVNECLANISNLPLMYPRGRHNLNIYKSFIKFLGGNNDFKTYIKNIVNLYQLPKPDQKHMSLILELDKSVLIGKTEYPFLGFNFRKDEEDKSIEIGQLGVDVLRVKQS